MKKTIYYSVAGLAFLAFAIYGFTSNQAATLEAVKPIDNTAIQWYSMEEALAAHQQAPKKLFIDVYTDWCGWCKVMDKKTFSQPEVISYLNENFYPVKLDAEQHGAIRYKGKDYQYVKAGRRGIHELAYLLLDRQASYPSFVVLDEQLERLGIMKGFKPAEAFLQELRQHVAVQ